MADEQSDWGREWNKRLENAGGKLTDLIDQATLYEQNVQGMATAYEQKQVKVANKKKVLDNYAQEIQITREEARIDKEYAEEEKAANEDRKKKLIETKDKLDTIIREKIAEDLVKVRAELENDYADKGKKMETNYSEKDKVLEEIGKKYSEQHATLEEMKKTLDKREEIVSKKEAEFSKFQEELKKRLKEKTYDIIKEEPDVSQPPEKKPYVSLGGDVQPETPVRKIIKGVKKVKIGVNEKPAPKEQAYKEPELAATVDAKGVSTQPDYLAQPKATEQPILPVMPEKQTIAAPQQEGAIYKHDFPLDQQDYVEKALKGFCGVESSQMTNQQSQTKMTLAPAKADEKNSERDYTFNKSTIKIEFNTKNEAIDTMLKGIEQGEPFKKVKLRPTGREKTIAKHADFAWLSYEEGTDDKGKFFMYELNGEQMKKYVDKPAPAKEEPIPVKEEPETNFRQVSKSVDGFLLNKFKEYKDLPSKEGKDGQMQVEMTDEQYKHYVNAWKAYNAEQEKETAKKVPKKKR